MHRTVLAAIATIALAMVDSAIAFQAPTLPRFSQTICPISHRRPQAPSLNFVAPSRGKAFVVGRLHMVLDSTSSRSKEGVTSKTEEDISKALETATPNEKAIYKSAIQRTFGWVGAASLFGMFLLLAFGPETSEEFFAGYLVEQSLSVDNLFVFLLLFEYFKVPLDSQDRVLNWGIFGAIVMRAIMIGIGAAALENFHEILLVFAGILVYSSAKALIPSDEEEEEDPSDNAIVKFSQNIISSTQSFDGDRFFTMIDGVKTATPLFICMIAVEISDVVFAVDSIPAVFGVTENPLVVFTSNMFAIMGLRSLYTILSKAASDLEYLEPAVAVVLGFIGSKMIAEYFGYCVPTEVALAVVAGLLGTGVGASLYTKKLEAAEE